METTSSSKSLSDPNKLGITMITSCYGIWTNRLFEFEPLATIVNRWSGETYSGRIYFELEKSIIKVHMYDKYEVHLIRIE